MLRLLSRSAGHSKEKWASDSERTTMSSVFMKTRCIWYPADRGTIAISAVSSDVMRSHSSHNRPQKSRDSAENVVSLGLVSCLKNTTKMRQWHYLVYHLIRFEILHVGSCLQTGHLGQRLCYTLPGMLGLYLERQSWTIGHLLSQIHKRRFTWHVRSMDIVQVACPIANRAHCMEERGAGNCGSEKWSDQEPQKISTGQVW